MQSVTQYFEASSAKVVFTQFDTQVRVILSRYKVEGQLITHIRPAIYLYSEDTRQFYTQVYVPFYPNREGVLGQIVTHLFVELSA